MDIQQHCEAMLADSAYLDSWMEKLAEILDTKTLTPEQREKFAIAQTIIQETAKQDALIHEIKMAACYIDERKKYIAQRSEEIDRKHVAVKLEIKRLDQELAKYEKKAEEPEAEPMVRVADENGPSEELQAFIPLFDDDEHNAKVEKRKKRRSLSATCHRFKNAIIRQRSSSSTRRLLYL